jgi:hypothetical protein
MCFRGDIFRRAFLHGGMFLGGIFHRGRYFPCGEVFSSVEPVNIKLVGKDKMNQVKHSLVGLTFAIKSLT